MVCLKYMETILAVFPCFGRQIFLFFSNFYLLKTGKIDNMQLNSFQLHVLENHRHWEV